VAIIDARVKSKVASADVEHHALARKKTRVRITEENIDGKLVEDQALLPNAFDSTNREFRRPAFDLSFPIESQCGWDDQ